MRAPVQLMAQLTIPVPPQKALQLELTVPYLSMLHQQLMLPSPRMMGHRLTAVPYLPMLHQQLPRHRQLPRQLMLPSPHMMGHRLTAVTYLSVRLGTLRQMRQQLLSCRPVTALMPVLPAPQPAPLMAARAQQAVLPGMGLIMRTA